MKTWIRHDSDVIDVIKGITYTYEVEMSINDGEALITVERY